MIPARIDPILKCVRALLMALFVFATQLFAGFFLLRLAAWAPG